jgi:hypothetical protein
MKPPWRTPTHQGFSEGIKSKFGNLNMTKQNKLPSLASKVMVAKFNGSIFLFQIFITYNFAR